MKKKMPTPSTQEVIFWLKQWEKLPDYTVQEYAINDVFKHYRSNGNIQNIIIKSSLLNDFCSTNIFKIYPVAKHILSLNVDNAFKEKDLKQYKITLEKQGKETKSTFPNWFEPFAKKIDLLMSERNKIPQWFKSYDKIFKKIQKFIFGQQKFNQDQQKINKIILEKFGEYDKLFEKHGWKK